MMMMKNDNLLVGKLRYLDNFNLTVDTSRKLLVH